MFGKLSALLVLTLPLLAGCATRPMPWTDGRWVDLTHSFSSETIYWPTSDPFHLIQVHSGITKKGYHYAANRFEASEHGGTHLDAPIHFSTRSPTVEKIPLSQAIGSGVVVDVSEFALKDRDYRVGVSDFKAWEHLNGVIPTQSIVLVRTGYSAFWPDAEKYLGTSEKGEAAVAKLHFPGLDPEAARWLVEERQVKAVGLDTASID